MALLPTEKTKPQTSFLGKIVVMTGPPGVGKTTAVNNLGALIQDSQKGTKALSGFVVNIPNWETALEAQRELLTTKNNFDFVGIDLANDFMKMLEIYICKENKVDQLNDLAYGKGKAIFKDHLFKYVMNYVNSNKTAIFITHEKEKVQKSKTAEITVMQTSLPEAGQELLYSLSDFIFYCYASSDGQRLMRTKPHRNIIAKDRFGILPEVMPLDLVKVKQALDAQNEGAKK